MLVKYQDSCSTCPLGLTRVASSSPNSEVFPLFEGVWGHPRRKSLGYYRKKETKQNKKHPPPKTKPQRLLFAGLTSGPRKTDLWLFLVWSSKGKGRMAWWVPICKTKLLPQLSAQNIPSREASEQREATGQRRTLLSHDPWPTGLQVLLKQLSNQLRPASL